MEDYPIRRHTKADGPSSGKMETAQLAMGPASLLSPADEGGIAADQSIGFMSPEVVPTKKMGIK